MVPDFVIAGAPKCDTTALYTYLLSYPSICMSDPKETNFFDTDIKRLLRWPATASDYEACFTHRRAGQITGEATARYLFSREAIPTIMAKCAMLGAPRTNAGRVEGLVTIRPLSAARFARIVQLLRFVE
jgi:hypothetical protein